MRRNLQYLLSARRTAELDAAVRKTLSQSRCLIDESRELSEICRRLRAAAAKTRKSVAAGD